jgi:Ni,Fe-hydrogenase I cytochrome b subunit
MDPITILVVCLICVIGIFVILHIYVKINESLKRKIIPVKALSGNIKNE